jgi:N-acetylneuraminic acid mutarotase
MKRHTIHILAFLMFSWLLGFSLISLAEEEGKWTKKADMPTARGGYAACTVNKKIYVISGGIPPMSDAPAIGAQDVPVVEEYDPATNMWTKMSDIPTPRRNVSASVVDEKIYVIGGWAFEEIHYVHGGFRNIGNVVPTVEEYDPATNTWTKKSDMPTARGGLTTCVVNGRIYAIGGVTDRMELVAAVEEYNPATDTWTKRSDIPTPRWNLSASVVERKIYVIGGWRKEKTIYKGGSERKIWVVSTVEEYDPATDTWTKRADMPTARGGLATCAVNKKIYAIGGTITPEQPDSTVEVYDPAMNMWTKQADMPTPRYNISAPALNGRIYIIGGWRLGGEQVLPTVEEYDPYPTIP